MVSQPSAYCCYEGYLYMDRTYNQTGNRGTPTKEWVYLVRIADDASLHPMYSMRLAKGASIC